MKYLLYTLAALILIVILGLSALLVFVDPNQFKGEIASQVEQQTGRSFEIQGSIKLSVFPWIGLQLARVVLGNAPGFGPQPFAEIKEAQVQVKLIPLLSKRLEVKHIVLDGLHLSLAKDEKGRTNWEDLARGEEETKAPGPEKPQSAKTAPKLAGMAVGGVTIKDAVIRWEDRQTGKTVRLEHINAHLDHLRFGQPADLDLGFVLHLDDPALKETLSLSTSLVIDENLQQFELRQLEIQSHTESKAVPSGRLDASLNSSVFLDLGKQTLAIQGLHLKAAEAIMEGDLNAASLLQQAEFSGQLNLHMNPRKTLGVLDLPLPATADENVLKSFGLSFGLAATQDSLTLHDLKAVLDDTHLDGRFSLASFSRPEINFELDVDALDADRYLPPPQTGQADEQPASAAGSPHSGSEKPLPLAELVALNPNGNLTIGLLKIKKLEMRDLKVGFVSQDRVLNLKSRVGQLYQGNFHATMRIDAQGRQPNINLDSKLDKVALGSLLQDYLAKEPPLSGTAFIEIALAGKGETSTAIKRTLDGNIAAHVRDGALSNMEFLTLIKQGEAWWKGEPTPPSSQHMDKLKFVALEFLASVKNGVVHTDRMLLDSRKLRIAGSGNIDLVQEQLDYAIRANRLRHEVDANGQEVAKAGKLPIIIAITGPLAKPRYVLDVAAMAKARFEKKINKKKARIEKKITEKLDKKLGPGMGNLLKGFLNQ